MLLQAVIQVRWVGHQIVDFEWRRQYRPGAAVPSFS